MAKKTRTKSEVRPEGIVVSRVVRRLTRVDQPRLPRDPDLSRTTQTTNTSRAFATRRPRSIDADTTRTQSDTNPRSAAPVRAGGSAAIGGDHRAATIRPRASCHT